MNESTTASSRWLHWLAIAAIVIGVGIGLAVLIAPMGVWLGLWPFQTGFAIMQFTVPLTGWITILCLLSAIAIFILTRQQETVIGGKLAGLALLGALAAGIAWYIPSTYQGDFPPIHDVSTDVDNPPEYVAILPLRADAPNPVEYGVSRAVPPEEHAEVQREAYPDLVPQYYQAEPDTVFERAVAAVDAMGWELVEAAPEEGRIEATDTTFWFRFTDDIVIRIAEEDGRTRVDARSLSRVGVGDVGANAERLREFFAIL